MMLMVAMMVAMVMMCGNIFSGDWRPVYYERKDGKATLTWLKEQPWFNGVLGTFGPSYLGFTQFALLGMQ